MSIFKISPESNSFVTKVIEGNKCRSLAASVAVALMVTEIAPASTRGNDVLSCEHTSNSLESLIQMVPLDVGCIRELAGRITRWREAVVAGGQLNGIVGDETPLEDLLGLSRFLDKATLDCMKDCAIEVSRLKTGFYNLLIELSNQA